MYFELLIHMKSGKKLMNKQNVHLLIEVSMRYYLKQVEFNVGYWCTKYACRDLFYCSAKGRNPAIALCCFTI